MSKKSLILCIVAAVLLLAGIGVALAFLYSGSGAPKKVAPPVRSALLSAVPSDAAAVICFSDLQTGAELLPAGIVPDPELKPSVVSLHYSGKLVPLMIAEGEEKGSYKFSSPSETLVNSANRHLEGGESILDKEEFLQALDQASGRNMILVSNEYASNLVSSYFGSGYGAYATFAKGLADWMAFSVKECSERMLSLTGAASYGNSASYFMNVLKDQGAGESRITDVLPSTTTFAFSLQISDLATYREAYQKYLDASQKLASFDRSSNALQGQNGISPMDWAQQLGIREVVLARWKNLEGNEETALFLRTKAAQKGEPVIEENACADYPALVFGDLFRLKDESCRVSLGEWFVAGSRAALEDAVLAYTEGDRYAYATPSLIITYAKSRFNIERVKISGADARRSSGGAMVAKVEVPTGPFEVKNSGTGKTNLFYQNENLYLCLKEVEGKGLWGVTFSEPICGRVETIDYYNNGKLQFLFAAGSKLYLIDRLGRFVKGFPAELGKDVLLGPAAYDFTGAGGYTALVLHTDNTIGMYNLHGEAPAQWKGISCADTILDLSKLVEDKGKRYWAVPTARETVVFDYWGGEPLKEKETKNLVY